MPTMRFTSLTQNASNVLASTLRDELLNTVRRYTPELKEAQQREIASQLMDRAQSLIFDVATAVSIGGSFPVVSAVLKDAGLGKNKILLQAATGEEFDKVRARHWNTQVALVLVSAEQFNEERTEPDISPDQGSIFGRQWQAAETEEAGAHEERRDDAGAADTPEPAPAPADGMADAGEPSAGAASPSVTVVAPGNRFRTGPIAGTGGTRSNLVDHVAMASLLTGTRGGMMTAAAYLNRRERDLGRNLTAEELAAEMPAAQQVAAAADADAPPEARAEEDQGKGRAGRPSAEKAAAGAAAYQRGQMDRLAGKSLVNDIPDEFRTDSYRLNKWRGGWKAKDREMKAAGEPNGGAAADADLLPEPVKA